MKRTAKTIVKGVAIALLAPILLLTGGFFYLNQPLPTGTKSAQADSLANRLLVAVHQQAWQRTSLVQWTFDKSHHYLWDKKRNLLAVNWKGVRVLLNLKNWQKGKAFLENREQTGNQLDKLRGKAWAFFCNDSYWLIAPTKVFDEGVERRLVKQADGSQALLVTFRSGGVTPGDSYLWLMDNHGLPTKFKMWVSVLPIGGLEASWQDWVELKTGALVPTKHRIGPLELSISDVKAGDSYQDLGFSTDPFLSVE